MDTVKRYVEIMLRWYTGVIDTIISWCERHRRLDFRHDPYQVVKNAFWTIPGLFRRIVVKTKSMYSHRL